MKENWYRSSSNIPDPTFIAAHADTTFYSDPATLTGQRITPLVIFISFLSAGSIK